MTRDLTRWCAVTAALIATTPSAARAQPKAEPPIHLELRYDVPQASAERCYKPSDFQDRVYVAIQYDAFKPPAVSGKLRVLVAQVDADVEVRWVHEDAGGKPVGQPYKGRAHTCYEALDDAIAALKDYLPPLPPPPPPPGTSPPSPSSSPIFVALGAGAGVRLGTGRTPEPGLALDAGMRWREKPASLAFEVRAALPIVTDVSSMPGTRVGTWLLTGALLPCGHYRWLVACGLVEAGAVSAAGAELSSRSLGPYVAMGARAGLEIPVGKAPMAVRLSGDLAGVLAGAQITSATGSAGDVWSMPRINGAFAAGLVGFVGR
jgi:hypothetical protein